MLKDLELTCKEVLFQELNRLGWFFLLRFTTNVTNLYYLLYSRVL